MGVFTVFQAAVFAPAQQPAIEDGNNRATISFEIKEPEITESEDAATISFEVLPQNEIGG